MAQNTPPRGTPPRAEARDTSDHRLRGSELKNGPGSERVQKRKAGHGFVRPGDRFAGFFFLLAGELSVYTEGKDAINYRDPENCLEAQFRAVKDGRWRATIIAETDVEVEIYTEAKLGVMITALRQTAAALEAEIIRLEKANLDYLHLLDQAGAENAQLSTDAGPARVAELEQALAAARAEAQDADERVESFTHLVHDLISTGSAGRRAQGWMENANERMREIEEDFQAIAENAAEVQVQLQQTEREKSRLEGELASARTRIAALERAAAQEPIVTFDADIEAVDLHQEIEREVEARIRAETAAELARKVKRITQLEAEVARLHGDVDAARRLAANALGRGPESVRRMLPRPKSGPPSQPHPPMPTLAGIPRVAPNIEEVEAVPVAEIDEGRPTLLGVPPPSDRRSQPHPVDEIVWDTADGDRSTQTYDASEAPTKPSSTR